MPRVKHIFISYRWSYTYYAAKLLQRHIEDTFEDTVVFRDEERATPGKSLSATIRDALDESDLVLALLHENWQQQPPKREGSSMNKLFLEDDWVRLELDYAKNKRRINVVPVLCDNAQLPPRNDEDEMHHVLPQCLHFLSNDTLAKKLGKSNEGEEGLLRFLEAELGLTRRKKTEQRPLRNRLQEEGLELPDILPDKEEVLEPYLGLPYFEEKHARLFFGRSVDICDLWDLVERKPNRLILLHGYSGVGKSSLLHAGFFPRIKQQGWTVVHRRRLADRSLHTLAAEMLAEVAPNEKTLLAVDQVEEALIKPFDEQDELPSFFEAIARATKQHANLKVLLGFRKEYLAEIQKAINASGLRAKTEGHLLEPLQASGVLEAIRLDEALQIHYGFEFEAGLEEQIAADFQEQEDELHQGETSSKAPWLQLLLLNLWRRAKEDKAFGTLQLTMRAFQKVRRQTFSDMVVHQLSKLEQKAEPHATYYRQGLTLDLLDFLTTSSNTAGIRSDEALFQRYPVEKADLRAHLRLLENLQLVLRMVDRDKKVHTRLAHDALAHVIRQRHQESDKAVQRAHRIFESKKVAAGMETDDEGRPSPKTSYNPIGDKEDIRILREARPFMYRWSEEEQRAFDRGNAALEKAQRELMSKTAFVFETLLNDALGLIQSVDHLEALPKFKAALNVNVPIAEKQHRLQAGIEELVCFFTHTGRHYPQAQTASRLLLSIEPNETSRALIERCHEEKWNTLGNFLPLLNRFRHFSLSNFTERYFPTMIEVEGDTFDMGGKVSWQEPSPGQQQNVVHPVKIASFKLAQTPFTLYQYALYCAATGKPVTPNTPSWGRWGDHPLVHVSWYDAVEIANWLSVSYDREPYYVLNKTRGSDEHNQTTDPYKYLVSIREGTTGFRLPTEAEWEFAARGGVKRRSKTANEGFVKNLSTAIGIDKTPDFPFAGSDTLDEVGWYWKNSGDQLLEGTYDYERVMANNGRAQPVKSLQPNELGLYDMSGNVWEWCWDWFDRDYYEQCKQEGVVENPGGPTGSKAGRVLRGGSWDGNEDICRVSLRVSYIPGSRDNDIGFRLAQDSL